MPDSRRYVVHGRMPLKRTPQSGLFTTRFKEDAFFIDFSERALLFNSGARTEQSLQLPLAFVEKAYHQKQRLVESIGFTGANERLELFIQYALLPLIDQATLDDFRKEVLERADAFRVSKMSRDPQSLLDALQLGWCDEPVLFFDYDRGAATLRIAARIPTTPPKSQVTLRTKRGRIGYYHEYETLLCSKAAFYIINAFESLQFVQLVELNLVRMEAEPVDGLLLVEETTKENREFGLRRIDPSTRPAIETAKERKVREKAEREKAKAEEAQLKALTKEKKKLAVSQRQRDENDDLFDGTLPYQSTLLSARIPRQGFMDLQKSKTSYAARQALALFDLRLDSDEESTFIKEVTPYFQM